MNIQKNIGKNLQKKIIRRTRKYITQNKRIKHRYHNADHLTIAFFSILFGIIILRLIHIQIFQASHYEEIITKLHYKESLLKATRGDIYVYDKGGNAIPVTKNITLYDIFLEPQYFEQKNKDNKIIDTTAAPKNKEEFIRILTPHIYEHLCRQYGVLTVTPEQCARHIELFTKTPILPEKPAFFYTGSGTILGPSGEDQNQAYYTYDQTGYNNEYTTALANLTKDKALKLISNTLDKIITIGPKESNYLGFFTDGDLLADLAELPYITIYEYYAYIIPSKIIDINQAKKNLTQIFTNHQQESLIPHAIKQLTTKDNKYVKLLTNVHPDIANNIQNIKKEYADIFYQCKPRNQDTITKKIKTITKEKDTLTTQKHNKTLAGENTTAIDKTITTLQSEIERLESDIEECQNKQSMLGHTMNVPFLHGLGLESYDSRYYPYNSFLTHAIGMVNSQGEPLYGIEEYMNDQLKGKDGKIIGRSSGTIGAIGANEFDVEDPINGNDIYLTIDKNIQKYVEDILPYYLNRFKADSISVIVMEPQTGYIKALSNVPTYNPNNINTAFRFVPLSPEQAYIADREDYIDIHLFIKKEDGSMRKATTEERNDPTILKRIAENTYGSEVFVDKTIKYAYEPGSVFKPLTVAIGMDVDEISLYDFYSDRGEANITDEKGNILYTIKNVSSSCLGEKSYLNALTFSCNVGMINIIQKIGRPIFYNYLKKLGFGSPTNVELAGEESGFIEQANTVSYSRFLNNSFGLGLRATPMQLAQGFATLLNGGRLIKPTIIDTIYDTKKEIFIPNEPRMLRRIFTEETANEVKDALFEIVEGNPESKENVHLEGFSLGGKTGTAEIVYKGKYRGSDGWTNASFIGVVTQEDPQYIVVVQIRRPRRKRWGTYTAAPLFKDIAGFLIAYDLMQE